MSRRLRSLPTALAVMIAAIGAALTGPPSRTERATATVPTHADLKAVRRQVALLETDLALARARKPYIVVDVGAKRLTYGLIGMTLREIAALDISLDGAPAETGDSGAGPAALAGIVTLLDKENDPRLTPLTPEQIEAGAADENVADALPPEIPAAYNLTLKQPIVVRVEGIPEGKTAIRRAASWWQRIWPGWREGGRVKLRLTIRLDEGAARELYRSLLPGERLVIVPPSGFVLPDAGQESPRAIRAGRPAKPPATPGAPQAPEVPFRIPPPVPETPAEGETMEAAPAEEVPEVSAPAAQPSVPAPSPGDAPIAPEPSAPGSPAP